MSEALLAELRQAENLPSPLGVALEVLRLSQQEDVDLPEFADVFTHDPALVAKVIKMAKSSLFGLPREVANFRQAVTILGLRTVNLLALSCSPAADRRSGACRRSTTRAT